MSTVHVYPVTDRVEHDTSSGGCPCGPSTQAMFRDDGSNGWVITHHSLDGREERETAGEQLIPPPVDNEWLKTEPHGGDDAGSLIAFCGLVPLFMAVGVFGIHLAVGGHRPVLGGIVIACALASGVAISRWAAARLRSSADPGPVTP